MKASGAKAESNSASETSGRESDAASSTSANSGSGSERPRPDERSASTKALCPVNQPEASTGASVAVATDPATQFRSTLALGQLITAKTPSAGSRIIAGELRQMSNTLKHESAALRKEISSLPASLAESLKLVLEEDREQRNSSGMVARRPVHFGNFPYRRFPVYRIPRRVSLAFARKSVPGGPTTSPPRAGSSAAASGLSNPTAAAAAVAAALKSAAAVVADGGSRSVSPASSPDYGRPSDLTTSAAKVSATKGLSANQQAAPPTPLIGRRGTTNQSTQTMKSPQGMTARKVGHYLSPNNGSIFKNPWFARDRSSSSYDGEADTDSDSDE